MSCGFGGGFHGFKNRLWVASPGNIHLSAFLSPHRNIEHFHVGFPVLSAISVVQAIDTIEDLKNIAGIKWVNDILIENSKVGGVLAHTQPQGDIVTGVVLGFGVNVETTPKTIPTPFVPKSASLLDFASNTERCSQRLVFNHLIKYLDKNYRLLLSGRYDDLIDFYRERSVIIGKKVIVRPDTDEKEIKETIEGKVTGIGDNLELFIQGRDKPVYSGRLIFNN